MQRRNFVKSSILGASLLTGTNVFSSTIDENAAQPKFKMKYAPHEGMFKYHGGYVFGQIKFAADQGFTAWEDNDMMKRSPSDQEKIGKLLADNNMTMGVFVVGFDTWPPSTTLASGDKVWREKFLNTCKEAINTAKRINAKWMTVVPGNFERSIPMGIQTGNVIESLKMGATLLEPHSLTMVLEPLSDNPDLFLRHSDQTYMICKAVGSPACKLLFDIYHMQRNEGNLIKNIDLCWNEIAYIQIGDNPGRNEPTTGEINYKNIFNHLAKKGYTGVLGMEHGNATAEKNGELKLIKAYRESDIE
jgi:hydroxypyruvate isomerase